APAVSCSISTRESFRSQSSTCRERSNVFFCINDWPNGGRDCFRRHGFTSGIRGATGFAELRLLDPRRQQHCSEQQRGCEIIRRAGHIKRMLRIDEPGEYSREQERPEDERDGAQALNRSLQFTLLPFADAMSHHPLRRGE